MKQTKEVKAILKEIDRQINNSKNLKRTLLKSRFYNHANDEIQRIQALRSVHNWITNHKP